MISRGLRTDLKPCTGKVKFDRFMTMAQYSWHSFAREFAHYDLADSMHMMCPPRKWTKNAELGGFILNITPGIPFPEVMQEGIFQHWRDQVEEIRRLGKPFDFWAVHEGEKLPSGPGYRMLNCQMPEEEYHYMMARVGDLFLGWSIGELDGLYGRDVVYYWSAEERPESRREAHDRFVAHLADLSEKVCGNVCTLCGCTFPHYLDEVSIRMLGAEVAQGLLNNQVYISFLRGACRQYDLQYMIVASVFDRWGYRCYTDSPAVTLETQDGLIAEWPAGPHHGHSVGLLQAIWVTSYFAGAMIVGLDGSFYTDELSNGVRQLSPLGKALAAFTDWARDPCPRGKQVRPVAVMLDYYAGWAPPRHLYSFEERVVWHSIPYGPSDHAMDQAYDIFYPGYCRAGYFRDERGFIAPTPLGDAVDVLLSDASADVMSDYRVIWLISDEEPYDNLMDRLADYVAAGGHLIVGGEPMLKLLARLFDHTVSREKTHAIASIVAETGEEVREGYFSVRSLALDDNWSVHARTEAGEPVIARRDYGKGMITVLAADHGLTDDLTAPGLDKNRKLDYTPDPQFELLHSVQRYVSQSVSNLLPVRVAGPGVYYAINKIGSDRFIVCLYNPGHEPWTGSVALRDGPGVLKETHGPWCGASSVDGQAMTLKGNGTAVLEVSKT